MKQLYWVILDCRLAVSASCPEEAKALAERRAKHAVHYADAYDQTPIVAEPETESERRAVKDLLESLADGDTTERSSVVQGDCTIGDALDRILPAGWAGAA